MPAEQPDERRHESTVGDASILENHVTKVQRAVILASNVSIKGESLTKGTLDRGNP